MIKVIPTSTVEKPRKAFQPCWWGVLTKEEKEGKRGEKRKEEKKREERTEILPHPMLSNSQVVIGNFGGADFYY